MVPERNRAMQDDAALVLCQLALVHLIKTHGLAVKTVQFVTAVVASPTNLLNHSCKCILQADLLAGLKVFCSDTIQDTLASVPASIVSGAPNHDCSHRVSHCSETSVKPDAKGWGCPFCLPREVLHTPASHPGACMVPPPLAIVLWYGWGPPC